MAVIPENLKDEVSREYEKIYTQGGNSARRSANEFLHNTAVKYKSQPKVDVKVKPEPPKQSPEPSKQKMNTMAAIEEEKPRKSFLDGLLDDVDKKHRR